MVINNGWAEGSVPPDQERVAGAFRAMIDSDAYNTIIHTDPGAVGDEGAWLAFVNRLTYFVFLSGWIAGLSEEAREQTERLAKRWLN